MDFLVQEADGTSKFTLEDASGSILLETSAGDALVHRLLMLGMGV